MGKIIRRTILGIVVIIVAIILSIICFKKVDNIDYTFKTDDGVIGKWKSVDIVLNIDDFKPNIKSFKSDIPYKEIEFLQDGKTSLSSSSWTKGLLLNTKNKTAGKYQIKSINGKTYMFLEWKTGDYIYLHKDPYYYMLEKE